MEITGVIKDATIITVTDLFDDNNNVARFVFGTVVSDRQQRFEEGNWFLSSRIKNNIGSRIITKNSVYDLAEAPSFCNLTLDEFRYVQQGHEPLIAKKLASVLMPV